MLLKPRTRTRLLAPLLALLLLVVGCGGSSDPDPVEDEEGDGGPAPIWSEWRCDVDGDGSITHADAALVFDYVSETRTLTSVEFAQADASPIGHPDGKLDLTDVLVVTRAVNGNHDICHTPDVPPLEANQPAFEWQEPDSLGVGDPVFPPGPYIDVTDMPVDCFCPNAVADGVTNDAPAISMAILYACEHGISNVYLPAGNYAIGPASGGWGYSGIGYETYMCPETVEIFGDGPSTVLMPNSTVGNFLVQVCYDWGSDIPDGNPEKIGYTCDSTNQSYVPTSRLVLHDMTWLDPDPDYHNSAGAEESHGLAVFPTLGSLEVYNIEVVDIGDEAMDLKMHPDSYAWLHHNEFYGVPSIGGGSPYAVYSAGTIIIENSIMDALGSERPSSRSGSCFDINPNSVPGRRMRDVLIRDNWCRGRVHGVKVALTGDDDEPIEWLEITNNYIEAAPRKSSMGGNYAAIRLRPNATDERDAFILGGLISANEIYGPVRFDADGIFDLTFEWNSVRPVKTIVEQHGVRSASATSPVVVEAASHALIDGQEVKFRGVTDMTELNGRTFTVQNSQPGPSGSFELRHEDGSERDPGLFGAIEFELGALPVTRAVLPDIDPPTIRLHVRHRLQVGDIIQTSGFETMSEIDDRRFQITRVTADLVEFEVDGSLDYPRDEGPDMRIQLVPDGPGVKLRGRRINVANNTVSGFADACIVVHPFATSVADTCEDGAAHIVDMQIVDNDFDCDAGQREDHHYVVGETPFGLACAPEPGQSGEFVIRGNTFLVDEMPNHASGAISVREPWPNLQVENNRIYRPSTAVGGRAITVVHADGAVVSDNEIRWAGEGVSLYLLDDALVENNKIELFGMAAYFDSGISLNSVTGSTISQNTICGSPNESEENVEVNGGSGNLLFENVAAPAGCFNSAP